MSGSNREKPDHAASGSPYDPASTSFPAEDRPDRAYSFGAYLRSRAGFLLGMVALMLVVASIMVVTSSNASSIALVSICEALFACIALIVGFSRDREFYQQLNLFCDSPDNARYLSSILDKPHTLEGSIAYRALGNTERGFLHREVKPCGALAQGVPPKVAHAHRHGSLA